MPGVLWSKQTLTRVVSHVFCVFFIRKHLALYVSSARTYLLQVNYEEVNASDLELDDRLYHRPSGLCHLLCHLKAGNWLASSYLLLETPPSCSVPHPQHEISFPTAWNSALTVGNNKAHLASGLNPHFHLWLQSFSYGECEGGVTVKLNAGDVH